jgi:hypothetical protein
MRGEQQDQHPTVGRRRRKRQHEKEEDEKAPHRCSINAVPRRPAPVKPHHDAVKGASRHAALLC